MLVGEARRKAPWKRFDVGTDRIVCRFFYQRKKLPYYQWKSRDHLLLLPLDERQNSWSFLDIIEIMEHWSDSLRLERMHSSVNIKERRHVWKLMEKIDGNDTVIGRLVSDDWFRTWTFELRIFSESLIVEDNYHNGWHFIKTAYPGVEHSKCCATFMSYCVPLLSPEMAQTHGHLLKGRYDCHGLIEVLKKFGGQSEVWWVGPKLQGFVHIFPWATSVVQNATWFSLDASFKCLKPWTFFVPVFTVCNTSIPIGISVYTGETQELYTNFFNSLSDANMEKIREMTCCSDEGRAIQGALEYAGVKQVLCHRHIIENLGSHGMLGVLGRILLKSQSEEEFERNLNFTNAIVEEMIRSGRVINLEKYGKLTSQELVGGRWVPAEDQSYREKVGLWCRGHVANTTNLHESMHLSLWKRVRPNGTRVRFCHALDLMLQYEEECKTKMHKKAMRNIDNAFRKVKRIKLSEYCDACSCENAREMSRRWEADVPWPCCHVDPEKREKMLEAFKQNVMQKIDAFTQKLKDETPQFRLREHQLAQMVYGEPPRKKQRPPRSKTQTEEKVCPYLDEHEKLAFTFAQTMCPGLPEDCIRSVHAVSLVCHTTIQENKQMNKPALFIKCYEAVVTRLRRSRQQLRITRASNIQVPRE